MSDTIKRNCECCETEDDCINGLCQCCSLHNSILYARIEDLKSRIGYLEKRDCNATIQLCYNDGMNPFAREDLQIVDVGVSDNCYVVESKAVGLLIDRVKVLEGAIRLCKEYNDAGENYTSPTKDSAQALSDLFSLIDDIEFIESED